VRAAGITMFVLGNSAVRVFSRYILILALSALQLAFYSFRRLIFFFRFSHCEKTRKKSMAAFRASFETASRLVCARLYL